MTRCIPANVNKKGKKKERKKERKKVRKRKFYIQKFTSTSFKDIADSTL